MFSKWLRQAGRLAFDNRAAASIEYALIAILIGIGALAALTAMADSVIRIWTDVEVEVTDTISGMEEEETGAAGLDLGNFNKTKKNKGRGKEKSKEKKPKG